MYENKLRQYMLENFLFSDDESELNNEDSFLDMGVVDSTGIMEVIAYIEDEFEVNVEDEEMIPENLDSINSLVAYLTKKLS